MDSKRIKLEPIFNINDLLDECLEEIFSKLNGRQQLKARLVCKHWNQLLLTLPGLLQKSVGISMAFPDKIKREPDAHISKMNPSLRVFRVDVNASMFFPSNVCKLSLLTPQEYFEPFHFDFVEELHFGLTHPWRRNFSVLFVLLKKTKRLKNLILKNFTFQLEEELSEDYNVTFSTVENFLINIDFEQVWSEKTFQSISFLCEKFPNLKKVSGVPGYNKKFNERFSDLIERPVLEINAQTEDILRETFLKCKQFRFFAILKNNYDTKIFWQNLNQNMKDIESISLMYDNLGNHLYDGDGHVGVLAIPHANYSKVKKLKLHNQIFTSSENMYRDLVLFSAVETLELSYIIHTKHFFGHQPLTELRHLKKASITLHKRKKDCNKCIDSLIRSLSTVKKLRFSSFMSFVIYSIGQNIPQIEELTFQKLEKNDDIFMCWPRTPKLQKLVMPGQNNPKPESIEHFCEMCPNMRSIEFNGCDVFSIDILKIFLKKLKHLETINFGNRKLYVSMQNEKRRLQEANKF